MTEKPSTEFPQIPDPGNVPVTFVNHVASGGQYAGVVNMTLVVARFTPDGKGGVDNDLAVAARLRMDMACAMQMRDELNRIIAQAEAGLKQMMATALVSTASPGKSGKGN